MNPRQPVTVSCTEHSESLIKQATDLADSLGLSFILPGNNLNPFVLFLSEEGLELRVKETGKNKHSSLFIDFTHGPSGYRMRKNLTIHQPLARAVGIKSGFRPDVMDAAAGMGGDGFILACLGCNVTMIERSSIIGALLRDGLERAKKDEYCRLIVQDRIKLLIDDAILCVATITPKPYTVYIDPMYPHRRKSALNKIEMRIIRQLVGSDQDSPALLGQALQTATNRVVVKRPKGAPAIDGTKPTHTITMKNSRFDVYLVSGKN